MSRRDILTSPRVWPILLAITGCSVLISQKNRPAPTGVQFSEHLISKDYTYSYGICAADLDGDGDIDLVSADARTHNALYWYENDGNGNFKRHTIFASPVTGTEDFRIQELTRMERHVVADINHDGYPDIVIVDNKAGDVRWFENDGTPRDDKPWRLHTITRGELPGAYDVAVADLDGDGHLDVVASSWRMGNQFAWFQNPGIVDPKNEQTWTKHLIDGDVAETRTVQVGDINGDGRPDLVGTATQAGLVVWYENPGGPETQAWKKHVIDRAFRPTHGHLVDIDKDGDLDFVLAGGMAPNLAAPGTPALPQVVWYENVGRPGKGTVWKKHVIAARFEDGFEAVAADIDGDGDLDVIATSWALPGKLVWFENPGDPGGAWTMHVIKDKWMSANQVVIADFDGDHKADLAASADNKSQEVRWWRNQGRTQKQ